MQINNKQDLFYSLTLTPGSQEYFTLPLPAGASGVRMVVKEIITDAGTIPKTDPNWGIKNPASEATGWESMFEQLRIEDATRTSNDVVMDLRYSETTGANDFEYFNEALMLASPLPQETYSIRSSDHCDMYTGVMGTPRFFIKTRDATGLTASCNVAGYLPIGGTASTSVTSITIGFIALYGPAIAAQSIRVYHVGDATDKTIEYIYPSGASPRSTVFTETARGLQDIYIDGVHVTGHPQTMITDYNVLRGIDSNELVGQDTRLAQKAYFNVGSLAGQRIRYEQNTAGKIHIVAIYTEA